MTAGRAHKKHVEDWLCAVFDDAGIGEARQLAREVILLMDGAFAVVLLHRDPSYMDAAGEAAVRLIRGRLAPTACNTGGVDGGSLRLSLSGGSA
jgi:hypothetical protein